MLPSASGLQRAFACPASQVLPHANRTNEHAERGSAVHEFLASVGVLGREDALANVPEEWRAACEAIDVDSLPACDASAYAAEVAFVYDLGTGAGREVGRNIGRSYPRLSDFEVPGTADVVALTADGDGVFVADYKGAHAKVPRARENWQLRFLALAACRAYGRSRATVAIVRIRDDGSPWFDSAEFDAFDLDVFHAELLAKHAEIRNLAVAEESGALLSVNMGEHCRYCPAYQTCPGQTGLVRQMAQDPETLAAGITSMLTPETAAKAYVRLRQVREALKHIDSALYAYALEHPIPLADGFVYGPTESSRDELDGVKARAALLKKYGPEIADAACEFETSKKAVDRAMRKLLQAKKDCGEKVTLKALNEEALAEIRKAGGLTTKTGVTVREHRAELPALEEANQ